MNEQQLFNNSILPTAHENSHENDYVETLHNKSVFR